MSEQPEILELLEFDLGDRLRKSLKVSGISPTEIAEYLGVARETVSTWTNGRHKPNRAIQRLWALRTGVPFEWLETGRITMAPSPDGEGVSAANPIKTRRTSRNKWDTSAVVDLFPALGLVA